MYGVRQTKTSPLSIISFKKMFLILKAKSALNPDYDSVPLKQLLCEDHEVWNWMKYQDIIRGGERRGEEY